MGREGVFQHKVKDRPDGIDIEFRTIDLMHFHPAERLSNHFRIAEVFRAVRGQGHRRTQGSDEAEINNVSPSIVNDHVFGLDVLMPQPAFVIRRKRLEKVAGVLHDACKLLFVQSSFA